MTQDKIKFEVPSFMYGTLPAPGVVDKDYIVIGKDEVKVTIKQSTNTFYDDKTRTFNSTQTGNTIFYIFSFPKDTQIQENKTFTTPMNSVYTFSHATDNSNLNYQFEKIVSQGTITIVPPPVPVTNLSSSTSTSVPYVNQDSLPNTPLKDDFMSDFLKDSPFQSIFVIVNKLFTEMVPVIIFWFLMMSLSCWLVVKSSDIYPTDVLKFPYIFYETGKKGQDISTSDKKSERLCREIDPTEVTKKLEIQNNYFKELDNNKDHDIIEIVNPSLFNRSVSGVRYISKQLINLCSGEICNYHYIIFFLSKIVLNNYVYCNKVLSVIHSGASMINNKVLSNIDAPFSIVLFAFLLYFLYLSVDSVKQMVMDKFNIKLSENNDMKTFMLNQFYMVLISILSCCFCLIIPLSTILVITSLMATAFTTIQMLFSAFNAGIFFLAFLTFFFSLSQYVLIILKLSGGMNVLDLMESLYVKDFNWFTFLSIFGITLPILMGLLYSVYIGTNLFMTFFQFLRIPDVVQRMKSSSASIVLVALFLLLMNVKETLGNSYVVMTLTLIFFIGLYVFTKKA